MHGELNRSGSDGRLRLLDSTKGRRNELGRQRGADSSKDIIVCGRIASELGGERGAAVGKVVQRYGDGRCVRSVASRSCSE